MKSPLEYDKFYHIYNRGNNYENLFIEGEDYKHFLNLFNIYINPIAEIYAWCLMKNHFHILVRIKDESEIGYLSSKNASSEEPEVKWKTYFDVKISKEFIKKPKPVQQFKHLFNAYSRWFNIKHNRRGSLFEKNYERKLVNSNRHLTKLIIYIHNNPVKHGFVEHTVEYPWSSYHLITSNESNYPKGEEIVSCFDDLENFKLLHENSIDVNNNDLKDLIVE